MSDTAREWAERARKAQEAVNALGAGPPASRITDADRRLVTRARELAAARDAGALRVIAGSRPGTDNAMVYGEALGVAQYLLGELAAVIARLGGGGAMTDAGYYDRINATPGDTIRRCPSCGHVAATCDGTECYWCPEGYCARCPDCDGPVPDEEE
jgi:hypothetical protein